MLFETYAHRFADIILNSDYAIRQEIDQVVRSVTIVDAREIFDTQNASKQTSGKKPAKGLQASLNAVFRARFDALGWEREKNVFEDPGQDLAIDFWKREVGVDVAFVHRSFIGGDLLRLQAAAEVKNVVKVGVYICPLKSFARTVSPSDGNSLVNFERVLWYLKNFYTVLTVPILVYGIREASPVDQSV